jgi:hypothetical protein
MIRAIKQNFARLYKWTNAVLVSAVQPHADVVCLQEPPRERGGFGICSSAEEIRKRKRVWTAVPKGSGLVVDEWTD